MSTIKSARFNNILPLFQADAVKPTGAVAIIDERPRLYLDLLQGAFEKELAKGTGVAAAAAAMILDPATMPQLQNQYYEPMDPGSDPRDMHSEWGVFDSDLVNHRLTTKGKSTKNPELLNIIKVLSGSDPLANPFILFLREVIRKHFEIIGTKRVAPGATATTGGDDITDDSTQWHTVTEIKGNTNSIIPATAKAAATKAATKAASTKSVFSYKLETFILHQLLETAGNTPVSIGDSFWDTDDTVNNTYYRLASDRSKLYKTDASGNKVDVSKGSTYYADTVKDKSKRCSGHYVKESSGATCTDYLLKCIIKGDPKDINACKQFMLNGDFWEATQKEIDEMLPTHAEDTLRRFGFQTETSNGLTVFQTIGEWFKNLEKQLDTATPAGSLTPAELKAIIDNHKLKGYLGMLISKVNSNPAILNKNYNARYSHDEVDHDNSFKGWTLSRLGLNRRYMVEPANDLSKINRLSNVISSNLSSLSMITKNRISIGSSGNVLVLGMPYYGLGATYKMVGGGNDDMIGGYTELMNANEPQLRQNYPLLKTLFEYIERSIESKGKSLDSTTKAKIEEHLNKYKDSEEKLFKAIRYADKYLDLVSVYKQYDPNEVLSIEHLKKFVEIRDKYLNRTSGKQDDLLSALEQIFINFTENLEKKLKE